MRWFVPILLAAASGCSNGSSTSNHDMQATGGGDMAMVLSCSQTVDGRCAAGGCVRDLASAQQASSWCPDGGTSMVGSVTLQHCAGGQTVITVGYVDSSDEMVYASGALVAVLSMEPHSATVVCTGGPTTFAAPTGCDTATTLCAGP